MDRKNYCAQAEASHLFCVRVGGCAAHAVKQPQLSCNSAHSTARGPSFETANSQNSFSRSRGSAYTHYIQWVRFAALHESLYIVCQDPDDAARRRRQRHWLSLYVPTNQSRGEFTPWTQPLYIHASVCSLCGSLESNSSEVNKAKGESLGVRHLICTFHTPTLLHRPRVDACTSAATCLR